MIREVQLVNPVHLNHQLALRLGGTKEAEVIDIGRVALGDGAVLLLLRCVECGTVLVEGEDYRVIEPEPWEQDATWEGDEAEDEPWRSTPPGS